MPINSEDEEKENKKFLHRTKIVVEIIGVVVLPVVIAVVGWHFTNMRDTHDEAQQRIESIQQLISLMDRLEDAAPRKKEDALLLLRHYASNCDNAEAIVPVLFDGLNDPTDEVRSETDQTLKGIHKNCSKVRDEIETRWAMETDRTGTTAGGSASLPGPGIPMGTPTAVRPMARQTPDVSPRVYIHIEKEDQLTNAKAIQASLEGSGFSVPKIVKIEVGPSKSQLRFFKPEDEKTADKIAKLLPIPGIQVQQITGYENSTRIRPHHFELWLVPS
jgi:hypothetical protein